MALFPGASVIRVPHPDNMASAIAVGCGTLSDRIDCSRHHVAFGVLVFRTGHGSKSNESESNGPSLVNRDLSLPTGLWPSLLRYSATACCQAHPHRRA